MTIPDPRGRKSVPTMLSSTEDLPELWPPTTAMVGSDSQRVGKSLPPPWSPRAVQARWMRFIIPIRLSMDAILLLTCLPSSPVFQYGRDYSVVSVWGRTKKRSQGRLTGRARFEETESAGKKENLPAKEAKPFQGRRSLATAHWACIH